MEQFISITPKGNIFNGKGPGIVREQLTSAMYEATAFLEEKVKENLPTELDGLSRGIGIFGNQGGLRGGIHGEVEKGTLAIKGIVAHQSLYGDIIEKGRTPGQPPPPKGTLVRWIEVKLGMSQDQAERIEFVVRRKIGQKGFPGIHMFERAFEDNYEDLMKLFDKRGFEITRAL